MEKSYRIIVAGLLVLLAGFGQGTPANRQVEGISNPVRVACVGNSVTRGFGLADPEQESYPSQLQKLLGTGYHVGNFGHSGATLLNKGHRPFVQTTEYQAALDFQADIIIIHLGLNDTDPRNWPNFRDDFIADYMRLIDSFRNERNNPPRVFVCRMTPIFHGHPRFKSGTRDWFREIQNSIEQAARNTQSGIIDLHTPLYSRPHLFKDALHPNKEGASIIAKTVYEHITGNFGGLRLAPVFSDNMVLQQNRPVPVWGKANAGERIIASLHHQDDSTVADASGNWKITFSPLTAGGPYNLMVIAGERQSVSLRNVMAGEVWICAGQSNMEFNLKHAMNGASLIEDADRDHLRLINKKGIVRPDDIAWDSLDLVKINNLEFFGGTWESSGPSEAADFSAIGYSFGRMLSDTLKVPVGLVQISVGGAPAEAFIDRETLEFDPVLVDVLYNWKQNDFIMDWCRIRADRNLSASRDKLQRHPFEPSYIYEAALDDLKGFPVAGVIWYQGESNAHNALHYQNVFPALVRSWRQTFNDPGMPFYFAQLPGLSRPSWPLFRETQRQMALKVPNTAMVVTADLGDSLDVHPVRKLEIGQRLAWTALVKVYGFNNLPGGSPEISSVHQTSDQLILTFQGPGSLETSDNQPLRELEIAGEDGLFMPVTAKTEGNQILVDIPVHPVTRVRYAWKPYSRGNLINNYGWPVSTFDISCQPLVPAAGNCTVTHPVNHHQ